MGRGTRDNGTDANQAHYICQFSTPSSAAWHAKVCKSEACLWFHIDMVFPSDFPHFFNHQSSIINFPSSTFNFHFLCLCKQITLKRPYLWNMIISNTFVLSSIGQISWWWISLMEFIHKIPLFIQHHEIRIVVSNWANTYLSLFILQSICLAAKLQIQIVTLLKLLVKDFISVISKND